MRRTVLLAALMTALAAAPAQGAARLVVRGAGFGHGVGMSQYGAYGFAQQGADHAAILGHYYTGTQIGRLDGGGTEVRVLLKTARRIVFTNASSVAGGRRLDAAKRYIVTSGLGTAVTLRSASGRDLGSYASPLTITGGRTEDVENVFIGADPAPYLTSVDDPYDGMSPRHRWVKRMSLRSAQRRLGRLVRGRLVRIRVLQRGKSPRVVRAQIVGTGGSTTASGPTLRRKLGLYDTWARFTVITAKATRGDGNTPGTGPAPGAPTGGVRPGLARAAAFGASAGAGTLRGRVVRR
jgi:hypothetical protein